MHLQRLDDVTTTRQHDPERSLNSACQFHYLAGLGSKIDNAYTILFI